MKQRESVELKESAKNANKEPNEQHQSRQSTRLPAVFASDSLELKFA